MKRAAIPAVVLLAAATLAGGNAFAQARGPSAAEVRATGQNLAPSHLKQLELAVQQRREEEQRYVEAARDPAVRASRLAELEVWFARLPGRFRIEGRIKADGLATLETLAPMDTLAAIGRVVPMQIQVELSGKVTGVADCARVGEGIGVQCILNATWPVIDMDAPRVRAIARPSGSEAVKTLNPAVLVIGISQDPPVVRAQMVSAESLSHIWVGSLRDNAVRALRTNRCLQNRCITPLEIIAEPESEVVTIVLRSVAEHIGRVTVTLTMHRDPEARAEKPLKALRAR